MTRGGPEGASTTVVYEMVQAGFDRAQVAQGAAMSVVFFVIVLGIALWQRRILRQEREVT